MAVHCDVNTTLNNDANISLLLNGTRPIAEKDFQTLDYVNMVVIPVCVITSIIGNVITVIVLNTKQFSQFGSRFFLLALSIADLSVILSQPLKNIFVIRLIGSDIRSLSSFGCKFYFWFHRMGKMVSSWLVVCMAVERFVAVKFPFRVKTWFSKRNSLLIVFLLTIVIGGFNFGYSFYTDVDKNGICNPDLFDKNDTTTVMIHRHVLNTGVTLYFIAPLAILSVVIPILIVLLVKARNQQSQLGVPKGKSIILRPTTMLLSVMFAYILFVTPIGIVRILVVGTDANLFDFGNTWFSTLRDAAHILEIVNYTINFFLYLCTSIEFRMGVKSLFCASARFDRASFTC